MTQRRDFLQAHNLIHMNARGIGFLPPIETLSAEARAMHHGMEQAAVRAAANRSWS
jgi:hypothetical protein